MEKKTIWCLNNAKDIVGPNQQILKEEFGDKIIFGSRIQTIWDDVMPDYASNNLMPWCEYFVPIAAKCIGQNFERPDAAGYINRIRHYYKQKNQSDYSYFWTDECYKRRGYRMITPEFEGYYSILEKTAPNILIGYSQGGLVAKYLEWLDKVVYGDRGIVAGVITISSPNCGSPIANVKNKKSILKGLIKIGLVIITGQTVDFILEGMTDVVYGALSLFGEPLTEIVDVLNKVIASLSDEGDKYDTLIENLYSMINWLGGLRNDPDSSLFDLNIERLNDKDSVLNIINSKYPSSAVGIISTNNDLRELIDPDAAVVMKNVMLAAYDEKKHTSAASAASAEIDRDLDLIPRVVSALADLHYEKIQEIYINQVMVEHINVRTSAQIIKNVTGFYDDGVEVLGIEKLAHDFIIPSACQLTLDNGILVPSRNRVNNLANHRSGADAKYQAGQNNFEDVREILRGMV